MKDLKVTIGTTAATSFGSNFLIPDGTLAFKVDGTAVNLPSNLFYSLRLGSTGVDHEIDTAKTDLGKNTTGSNIGGFTASTKEIRPLNLTNGINVQLVDDGDEDLTSEFELSDDSTIENRIRYVQITFFRAVEDASFDPLNPLFDLEYVGHDTVQIWYAPANLYSVPVITAVSTDIDDGDTIKLTLTSNLAGKVYALVVPTGSAAPTINQVLAQVASYGSTVTVASEGFAAATAATSLTLTMAGITAADGTAEFDVYYVVVGTYFVSELNVIEGLAPTADAD
jgi:hypothetical protein